MSIQKQSILPISLLDQLAAAPGFDRASFEAVHAAGESVVSIRLNPGKLQRIPDSMSAQARKVPWSDHGYYLPERPLFTLDPLLHAGAYYVQEASSMFLEQAYRQSIAFAGLEQEALRVLDLCAAPGGKSTLLQSLLKPTDILIANEVIKTRVSILEENLTKWGSHQVAVTNNDPKDFARLSDYFDVLVVDAPCSGSGLFRKDPNAISHWSEDLVVLCSQRQQRILADVWSALKPGGVLIYSTCSYSVEENESMVDWLLANFPLQSVRLQISPMEGSIADNKGALETISSMQKGYGYRFYPNRVEGEGFFIAAFIKEGEGATPIHSRKLQPKNTCSKEEKALASTYLESDPYCFFKQGEQIRFMPVAAEGELSIWQEALYIKQAGTGIGEWARKDLIPAHELAMSMARLKSIPSIELDPAQALAYLRKEDFALDAAGKGWQLLSYQGQALGWAKILPNRLNNYYPKEWRIRMGGSI